MATRANQGTTSSPIWVGIDAGGTFTDFVVCHQARFETLKLLSTPEAPEEAILQGLEALGLLEEGLATSAPPEQDSQASAPLGQNVKILKSSDDSQDDFPAPTLFIIHGSTIATNAVLEGKGQSTAFVTNEGFEDLLHLGRQARPELYHLTPPPSARTFPHTKFFGVASRRSAEGEVLTPLTDAEIERLVAAIVETNPKGIALNLLFSYLNGEDEAALKEALAVALPEAFITASSELLPRHGEYERGVAVWLNAWLGPLVKDYLLKLCRAVPKAGCAVMQSSGITVAAEQAMERSVNLLLSGPAGGVIAADDIAQRNGLEKLLTFDMGGTSTDVSLISTHRSLTDIGAVGPYPVAVPMVNIHTIGAGGGSMVSVDAAGMLQVGPESAGAAPGPVCYGRGGEVATVTDANLALGLLVPEKFLGGRMTLNKEAALEALLRISRPMGLSVEEVAEAIIHIANEHMTQALRLMSLECGEDPREFTLCCFGGAGGLHLCALADNLGIQSAIVPAYGGVLSAFGMLLASPGREMNESIQRPLARWTEAKLNDKFEALQARGRAELLAEGVAEDALVSVRKLALRYVGQSHALEVPWTDCRQAADDFVSQHQKRHGFDLDEEIELVEVRISQSGPPPNIKRPRGYMKPVHVAHYAQTAGHGSVPVYNREGLPIGEHIQGPILIAEDTATTWVEPHWTFYRDEENCLQLFKTDAATDEGEGDDDPGGALDIPGHLITTT